MNNGFSIGQNQWGYVASIPAAWNNDATTVVFQIEYNHDAYTVLSMLTQDMLVDEIGCASLGTRTAKVNITVRRSTTGGLYWLVIGS